MFEIVDNDDVRRARHDLRTVVNHLQGYVTLLQEDDIAWNREPEIMQALEVIHESSHEVLRIVELAAPRERRMAPAKLLAQLSADLEAPAQAVHDALLSMAKIAPAAVHPDVQRLRQAYQRLHTFVSRGRIAGEQASKTVPGTASAVVGSALILIVEDDESNRDLLERMLRRYSYAVIGAATGAAALRCVARDNFDLILLDLILPDIDGFSLLGQLRSKTPLTPVIVTSALNDMDNVIRCIEAGAEDYCAKPFIPILLRTRVDSALDRKRYRALLAQAAASRDPTEQPR